MEISFLHKLESADYIKNLTAKCMGLYHYSKQACMEAKRVGSPLEYPTEKSKHVAYLISRKKAITLHAENMKCIHQKLAECHYIIRDYKANLEKFISEFDNYVHRLYSNNVQKELELTSHSPVKIDPKVTSESLNLPKEVCSNSSVSEVRSSVKLLPTLSSKKSTEPKKANPEEKHEEPIILHRANGQVNDAKQSRRNSDRLENQEKLMEDKEGPKKNWLLHRRESRTFKRPYIPIDKRRCLACCKFGHGLMNCTNFPSGHSRKHRLRTINICTKCLRVHKLGEANCKLKDMKICHFCKTKHLPYDHPVAVCEMKFIRLQSNC